jgi:photosystem II stability/assembly factor-like uncharacterized protein
MKHHLMIGVGLALTLALAGPSLLGGTGRAQVAPVPAAIPLDALHFRQLGPASTAGRVSDLAVYEANPAIFYVGTAHGGVWKTTNFGTTFEAQLQTQGLMSIGDVAVSQSNPDLVWAGTGESNNRQSTSWGDGVYKSLDGGRTWANVGLRTSRHVNRVLIDPRDNNVVFVAATGSLWGPGGDRGVYKTSDGGKTWKQVLKVDDDTGANDLAMDATNNRVLYASTYQRRRSACCMNGGGPGSGLWKSADAGETWTRLKVGLPEGALGRIAVDVYRRRGNVLYALVEGPTPAAPAGGRGTGAAPAEEAPGGQRGGASTAVSAAPTGLYRSDDAGATWKKVNNANPRPMYFSQVRIDPNDPEVVYLGGVGLHQTLDGGKTIATDVAASTHDDVHAIWINPADSHQVLIGNDGGVSVSYDQAKTWAFMPNLPIATFYHVSYDMATPYNVCGGMQDNYDWCGPSAVRGSSGVANHEWTTVQGGDGFVVLQDPTDYRIAYTESQDGNMVRLDRRTFETMSMRPQAAAGEAALRWQWDTPLTMSPHDSKVIYAPGNRVFRSPDRGLTWTAISPDLTANANRDEVVTMNVKGSEIQVAKNDGIAAWPAVTTFAESPKRAGVLYAGTDDGRLAVTKDLGKTWTQVIDKVPGLPKGIYVSKVAPSRFDEAVVYATFDGHRQNDFGTHVFASADYGQTWKAIGATLEGEVARTITEDLKNPDVLYVGTETGLFVTLDRGRRWNRLAANLPTVRIDEITLHPRDNAMLLATHGRGIWVLDNMAPIQELAAAQAADAKLFTLPAAMYRRPARDHNYEFWGDQTFYGENPPQAAVITWYMKKDAGEVKLTISDAATGKEVRSISGQVLANSRKAGVQSACWDLRVQPVPSAPSAGPGQGRGGRGEEAAGQARSAFGAGCPVQASGMGGGFGGFAGGTAGPFVLPGSYTVALVVDGKTVDSKPMRVEADPEVALTAIERKKLYDMAMEMHEFQALAAKVSSAITPLNARLGEVGKELANQVGVPAEVKSAVDALAKDVAATASKFAQPLGARGGARGGGASDSLVARIGQAKNGLMGGLWPGEPIMKAYSDVKAQAPKAMADANALIGRASTVGTTLSKYNVTLTAPEPVKLPAAAAASRK